MFGDLYTVTPRSPRTYIYFVVRGCCYTFHIHLHYDLPFVDVTFRYLLCHVRSTDPTLRLTALLRCHLTVIHLTITDLLLPTRNVPDLHTTIYSGVRFVDLLEWTTLFDLFCPLITLLNSPVTFDGPSHSVIHYVALLTGADFIANCGPVTLHTLRYSRYARSVFVPDLPLPTYVTLPLFTFIIRYTRFVHVTFAFPCLFPSTDYT